MHASGTITQASEPNWLSRNWKWLMALAVVLSVTAVMSFAWFIISLLANSEATRLAMERANQHPAVVQRLGQPIERSWLVLGNIRVNNSSGHAELKIPVSGPKGSGMLYVEATRKFDVWALTALVLGIGSNERHDLLAPVKED